MNLPTMFAPTATSRNLKVVKVRTVEIESGNMPNCGPGQKGFTLVEILVALFIFALITTTLFGSFNGVFSRTAELDQELAYYEMGPLCLNHIQRELKEILIQLPPAYKKPTSESTPDPYRLVGGASEIGSDGFGRLRFTTQTNLPMDTQMARPPQVIIYYVDETDDEQRVLKRALRSNEEEKDDFEPHGADATLCEGVLELEYSYIDSEGEIQESWDSESDDQEYATPRAIKISLLLGNQVTTTRFETTVVLPVWRNPMES